MLWCIQQRIHGPENQGKNMEAGGSHGNRKELDESGKNGLGICSMFGNNVKIGSYMSF